MRQKKVFLIILVLTILLVYITNIYTIPENIILLQNEEYKISYFKGIEVDGQNVQKENNFFKKLASIKSDVLGSMDLKVKAFGFIPVKEVTVNIIPSMTVIPCGNAIGVRLYTDGVLVVGKSEVDGIDFNTHKPYENSGIKEGDLIIEIDGNPVGNITDLIILINESEGKEMAVKYQRNEQIYETRLTAVKSREDNLYKIGLWVRDGAMGIGTLTFYEPESRKFGALGHGITDVDTKELLKIKNGALNEVNITSVERGVKGDPGELKGKLIDQSDIGMVEHNTNSGIYGSYYLNNTLLRNKEAIPIISRNQIKEGKASILCTINGTDVKEYEIEIEKIFNSNQDDTKSMVIRITDEALLAETGGIVQGMSGSPIIQNGKFVGAVTHVFVNDPTRGYAVFGDLMLREMESEKNR